MLWKDILFIVLALSIGILTFFIARLLYYIIAVVKDLRQTVATIHEKVDEVGRILESIRERIGDSVSALSMLAQMISKFAGGWRKRRAARTSKIASDQ